MDSLSKEVCDALSPVLHWLDYMTADGRHGIAICGESLPRDYWKKKWNTGGGDWVRCPGCASNPWY